MKMTKKLFLVAIATAAFALIGCDMLMPSGAGKETFGGKNENGTDNGNAAQTGVKKNLTVKIDAKVDKENGSLRYQRMFRQLGTKETVESLKTRIQIDTTGTDSLVAQKEAGTDLYINVDDISQGVNARELHAVTGLIFDMHKVTEKEVDDETGKKVKKNYYDFVLIGYRPYDNGFYVERFTNIAEDLFKAATNDTSFGTQTDDDYITASKSGFVYNNDIEDDKVNKSFKASWVNAFKGKLGKDDDGVEGKKDVDLKEFVVTITQPEAGKFNINVGGNNYTYTPADEKEAHPDWYTKDGKRIGAAGYYVNAPLGTSIYANFNSGNFEKDADGKTIKNEITKGLEEEVAE